MGFFTSFIMGTVSDPITHIRAFHTGVPPPPPHGVITNILFTDKALFVTLSVIKHVYKLQ